MDRAGIVGEDGATHHGIFDISYLRCIPNLTLFAPASLIELRNILYTAQLDLKGPLAIRYPRGRGVETEWNLPLEPIEWGKGRVLRTGDQVAVLSYGAIATEVTLALDRLKDRDIAIGHFDLRFINPLDADLLESVFESYQHIITVEDGVVQGGFGSAIIEFANKRTYFQKIHTLGIDGYFPQHGTVAELWREAGIHPEQIEQLVQSLL